MNKLLVSDIIDLKQGQYELNVKTNKLIINVSGNVKIYLYKEKIDNLIINLEDNSELFIYDFLNQSKNVEVKINEINKTSIHYNAVILNNEDNNYIINNDILGNDNKSYLNIRNISNGGLSKVDINVCVFAKTINNIAIEDLKGIINGGNILIEPNIVAKSNEVEANHLTTIGGVDVNSLNYLMSKGIDSKVAKEILLKGFIYSNMDEYIKNMGGEFNE